MNIRNKIEDLWSKPKDTYTEDDLKLFNEFKGGLNSGEFRAAEKIKGEWITNGWIKKGILIGFRMGKIVKMPTSNKHYFLDKDTYPERQFELVDKVRVVPGGSSVRDGAYIGKSVTMMPPMYVNVGAYVDDGSMVDSHALVGSCAQIGKNVHLSAGAIIGGVLEPIGANPVIVEDDCFIGSNSGIFDGIIVKEKAIIAAGVIMTTGTPVYDSVNNCFIEKKKDSPMIIPERAVIVPGSRPLKTNPEFSVYCPIIVKYRDAKSDTSVTLEDALR